MQLLIVYIKMKTQSVCIDAPGGLVEEVICLVIPLAHGSRARSSLGRPAGTASRICSDDSCSSDATATWRKAPLMAARSTCSLPGPGARTPRSRRSRAAAAPNSAASALAVPEPILRGFLTHLPGCCHREVSSGMPCEMGGGPSRQVEVQRDVERLQGMGLLKDLTQHRICEMAR